MRWIWIDKFIEFDSGRRARAIKNISLAEEHLHDHFPGYPVMPNSLIAEGLAQTGGLLVGEVNQFQEKVILAKIPKAVFHFPALPGDQLIYTATIEQLDAAGGRVAATSHVGERLQAEMEIVFAHLRDADRTKRLFEPKNFVFTMKLLGVFDVGRSRDGTRIQEPPGLASIKAAPGHDCSR
ncbi:MAG TPA: 3-hydroxyacyl-ACP dehydratase FabZ family protein [Pirellulales bacterium]|jgi:3-hydroxyacyl-[acyl-carrier-protein] dehydratase|nr:3-hydroxyacyl-ACP dehydratase FabZ family protein [Pirellulales bacterium]